MRRRATWRGPPGLPRRHSCQHLEFLHFDASARRPSHVHVAFVSLGRSFEGRLASPIQAPSPARFNGLPSRSDHGRLQNRETAPLPKGASPRWRAPPGGQRRSPGRRSGRPQPLQPTRSLPPSPPVAQKPLVLAKSTHPLQPVTYLLFLYPLFCQHLRPPAPRSAQPRLVKCE